MAATLGKHCSPVPFSGPATYPLFYLVITWILPSGSADPDAGVGLDIPCLRFLRVQPLTIVLFILGISLAAWLADRQDRQPALFWTAASIVSGPVAAVLPELFPTNLRCPGHLVSRHGAGRRVRRPRPRVMPGRRFDGRFDRIVVMQGIKDEDMTAM